MTVPDHGQRPHTQVMLEIAATRPFDADLGALDEINVTSSGLSPSQAVEIDAATNNRRV